ncbi:MAG TPA: YtxH domain-containing protein [Acidobacteriota bacterium]|nr:YtxH domain-containing protein [Acidobacteriota bacterium]
MNRSECGGICVAFLCGAAIGAATALLMAPQSGERTRRQLKRQAGQFHDYLEDVREDFQHRVHDVKQATEDAVKQLERRIRPN